MSYYNFVFEAQIERLAIGNGQKVLNYSVIILPDDYVSELPFSEYPKLRVIGDVGEHPIRGAWNPISDGRKYFILSSKFLKTAGLTIGDNTEMRFNIDDQDFVDVPDELAKQPSLNAPLNNHWMTLSSGKKRFFCHQIASAKQQTTRDKRLQSVISQLNAQFSK